jgi:hypothetical protein
MNKREGYAVEFDRFPGKNAVDIFQLMISAETFDERHEYALELLRKLRIG